MSGLYLTSSLTAHYTRFHRISLAFFAPCRRDCQTAPDRVSLLPERYPRVGEASFMRLTVKNVAAVRSGADRREIPDGHMPGLYLIVQPSGARSWAVRYRHQGVPRKHTLGSYPAVDLKAARTLARKALRAVAEGRDPGREKIAARAAKADSVDRIVEEFL